MDILSLCSEDLTLRDLLNWCSGDQIRWTNWEVEKMDRERLGLRSEQFPLSGLKLIMSVDAEGDSYSMAPDVTHIPEVRGGAPLRGGTSIHLERIAPPTTVGNTSECVLLWLCLIVGSCVETRFCSSPRPPRHDIAGAVVNIDR